MPQVEGKNCSEKVKFADDNPYGDFAPGNWPHVYCPVARKTILICVSEDGKNFNCYAKCVKNTDYPEKPDIVVLDDKS